MPIELVEPPSTALDAVRSGLRSIVAAGAAEGLAVGASDPEALTYDSPLQVFVIRADDLARGAGLAAARAVGWRYVVRDRGRAVATAEAAARVDGSHAFTHINEGPFVEPTAAVVEEAERFPEVRDAMFEPRLLEIPALHSTSLWLHGRHGHGDVVAPFPPAPPALQAGRRYPAAAFAEVVAAEAALIGEDEGLEGGSGS